MDGCARGAVAGQDGAWADLGAGEGTFTRALSEILGAASRIYAVDRDRAAVAELEAWADLAPALQLNPGPLRPGHPGQLLELPHLLPGQLGCSAGQLYPYQVSPLAGRVDLDQTWRFLRRSSASSSRASGAVTESLK